MIVVLYDLQKNRVKALAMPFDEACSHFAPNKNMAALRVVKLGALALENPYVGGNARLRRGCKNE